MTKVQVDKEPAFYETWWAYMLYVMLILLVCYSFIIEQNEECNYVMN